MTWLTGMRVHETVLDITFVEYLGMTSIIIMVIVNVPSFLLLYFSLTTDNMKPLFSH